MSISSPRAKSWLSPDEMHPKAKFSAYGISGDGRIPGVVGKRWGLEPTWMMRIRKPPAKMGQCGFWAPGMTRWSHTRLPGTCSCSQGRCGIMRGLQRLSHWNFQRRSRSERAVLYPSFTGCRQVSMAGILIGVGIRTGRRLVKGIGKACAICVALYCMGALTIADPLGLGGFQQVSLHWNKSTPFPEATSGYAAGVVQGELVLAGGTYWEGTPHHWNHKIFTATTYSFHPLTAKWDKLPDEPVTLGYAASTVVNDTLFVLGGYNGQHVSREILTFSKKGNHAVWKEYGKLPVDRVFAQAVTIGNSIYLVGGTTDFEPLDAIGTCCTSKTATHSLLVFDTKHPDRGWRELAPYPGAMRWSFTTETDGKSIWVFGGQFQANAKDPVQRFPQVLRYNPVNGEWIVAGRLPEELNTTAFVSPVYAEGRMILISSIKRTWQLDLATLTYKDLTPLPEATEVDKFVWLRNRLIGSGGENADNAGPRRRSDATFIGQILPD